MEAKEKAHLGSNPDASSGGGGGPLGLRGLIDTIIANLELRVTNIHVRFEDPSSWPGRTFAIGVMLSEISAHTVDEDGRRAFVTNEQLRTMRKVRAEAARTWACVGVGVGVGFGVGVGVGVATGASVGLESACQLPGRAGDKGFS
jgi:hypothetical protein